MLRGQRVRFPGAGHRDLANRHAFTGMQVQLVAVLHDPTSRFQLAVESIRARASGSGMYTSPVMREVVLIPTI